LCFRLHRILTSFVDNQGAIVPFSTISKAAGAIFLVNVTLFEELEILRGHVRLVSKRMTNHTAQLSLSSSSHVTALGRPNSNAPVEPPARVLSLRFLYVQIIMRVTVRQSSLKCPHAPLVMPSSIVRVLWPSISAQAFQRALAFSTVHLLSSQLLRLQQRLSPVDQQLPTPGAQRWLRTRLLAVGQSL